MEKRNGAVMIDGDKIILTQISKIIGNGAKEISAVQDGRTVTITGENLNVTEVNLENGRLAATGRVNAVKFHRATSVGGVLKKLFK